MTLTEGSCFIPTYTTLMLMHSLHLTGLMFRIKKQSVIRMLQRNQTVFSSALTKFIHRFKIKNMNMIWLLSGLYTLLFINIVGKSIYTYTHTAAYINTEGRCNLLYSADSVQFKAPNENGSFFIASFEVKSSHLHIS